MSHDDAKGPGPPGEPTKQIEHIHTAILHCADTSPPRGDPALDSGAIQAWVGKTLGKYRIVAALGQGGMAVVLKAHDPSLEREVAIKVLARHLAADADARSRFVAEAKAVGKINHPNVIAIYEICQDEPTPYLVMEYVPGGSLEDRLLRQGPLPLLQATRAAIDACRGIGAAHALGMIHRDVKPANFMRTADGAIKVSDFGLAKVASADAVGRTQLGVVVGTPCYMSPEQCEAKPMDARSDIYALGATYYSLLTGKRPYHEIESIAQLMYMQCQGPIPDPREIEVTIPEACARIVARAMAKAPANRYPTAADMLADLEAVSAALTGQTRIDLPSDTKHSTLHHGSAVRTASGEPVKVGVLHSLSGTMATSESVVVDALLFAFDEINQAGGVLGRPVEAIVVDGRSDWPTFAQEAERLLAQEKVCTVFGCWTSASRKTVKPIFEQHDNLLIYPVQFEGLETSPCIVYMGAAPNQQILPAVDWAVQTLGKKRFFLAGSDYIFPRTAHTILKDHFQRAKVQVVGEAYVPLGSQKLEAMVKALAKTKPDVILNSINGDSNTAFFRELRAAGIRSANVPTLSFSVGEQELRSLNPSDVAGDYAAWTYFQCVETPENGEFVRRFQRKNPRRSITDPMETAYVGVKLWAKAVDEAQSLEPRRIRRAMVNQRLKAPDGEVRIDADTHYCFRTPRIGQIQADGQFKIVWSASGPVQPVAYPASRSAETWRAFLHDLHAGWGNAWAPTVTEADRTLGDSGSGPKKPSKPAAKTPKGKGRRK